jgi:hypothetical protein
MSAELVESQAGSFQLPAIFLEPQEELEGRSMSPYITFAHPKRADEYKRLVSTFGPVEEGDMYLVTPKDCYYLQQAKLGLITAKQFWANVNQPGGDLIATSFKERPKPFREHIAAVMLVYLEDKVVPAFCMMRTTKCPIGKKLSDALIAATDAEAWAAKGPAFRESAALPQPFTRFYGLCSIGPSRPGSGNPYRPGVAEIRPTTMVEWRLLKEFSETEDYAEQLERAAERFTFTMDKFKQKLV